MEYAAAPEATTKKPLHYLTVQDILWINLQVTKKVQHFDYSRLEEASYYQYGYGDSRGLERQAARFLTGFLTLKPFDGQGNEETGFLGFAAFLLLNGKKLKVSDQEARDWIRKVADKQVKAEEVIDELVEEDHDFHAHANELVDECLRETIRRYPSMILGGPPSA